MKLNFFKLIWLSLLLTEPDFRITVSNEIACDALGEQVCLIRAVPENKVTFSVSVVISGVSESYTVRWYKFYTGQDPQFHRYVISLA